jgi:hypothetical protein
MTTPPFRRPDASRAGQRFFDDDLRDVRFLDEDFLRDDDLRGTLPPARRASERPIAMACFRLVTFLPDRPLFNIPRLRSCIAFSTFCDAFRPYFAIGPPCRGSVAFEKLDRAFVALRCGA